MHSQEIVSGESDYTTGPARVFLPIIANTHSREQVTIVAGYVEVRDGDRRWHEQDARSEKGTKL